jgi:hypothetical protein
MSYTSGRRGRCGSFNGSSSYIHLGTGLDVNSALTISAWFNTDTVLFLPRQILCNCNAAGNQQDYLLEINRTAGKLGFWWANSIILTGSTALSAGTWYHVAAVRSGSSGNWTAQLWLNGVLDNSATTALNPNASSAGTAIGRAGDLASLYFDGLIDEVALWSRALNSTDIRRVMLGLPPVG